MASRQGRQERPIDPQDGPLKAFAYGLRQVREGCGSPTYHEVATASARTGEKKPYSSTTFSNATRGDSPPSREVVRAFVLACHHCAKLDRATAETAAADWDARWLRLQAELAPATYAAASTEPPGGEEAAHGAVPLPGAEASAEPEAARLSGSSAGAGDDRFDVPPPPGVSGSRLRVVAGGRTRLVAGIGVCVALGVIAWAAVRFTTAPQTASADTLATDTTAAAPPSAAGSGTSAQLRPAAASEQPGLEKDTLGPDSRCSSPGQGPGSVTWRVCARVEADRISFALEITNRDSQSATVKARLQYTARTPDFRICPGAPDFQLVTVPAGQTLTTDTVRCSVPRTSVPTAYSGVGWVLGPEADSGTRMLSPGAHVYPDNVRWTPDVL
ncbi:hypothetical protein ACGF0D_39905 [Kitasatospora sp. NPDC048298]|uniref:hypothetical protein n=1 Tax=Kitasatospora sp. NPDC048298 TaxID=3364049 RepID=UPI003723957A